MQNTDGRERVNKILEAWQRQDGVHEYDMENKTEALQRKVRWSTLTRDLKKDLRSVAEAGWSARKRDSEPDGVIKL